MTDPIQTQTSAPADDASALPKLSAKSFREPLLRVLGNLTNFVASATMGHRGVYEPTLAVMGVDPDAYGLASGTKTFQTHRWIQFAFMGLKQEGLGSTPKKGQWGLTEAGVQAARTLAGVPAPAPPDPQKTPVVAVPAPPPPAAPVPKPSPSPYDGDPYLRSLAVAASKCVGFYSDRSGTCQSCPLGGQCRNKMAADLSAMATELRQEDEHKAAQEAQRTTGTAPQPKAAIAAPVPPSSKWSNKGIEKIVNHTETVCYRCQKPIPMKAPCFWKQDDGDGESGLFHVECK